MLALEFLLGGLSSWAGAQAPPGSLPRQPYPTLPSNVAPATEVSYPANYTPRPGVPATALQAPSGDPPAVAPPATAQPPFGQPVGVAPPLSLDPAMRAWIEKLVNDRVMEERAAQGYPAGGAPAGNAPGLPALQAPAPATQQPCGGTASPCNPWDGQPYSLDFKDGVLFQTNDGMFSLRINNLIQTDYRDFSHTAQGVHTTTSLHDNFTLARWWTYLTGNVTEFVDYQTVFAGGAATSGFGPANVNVLDAWIDINPFGKEYKEYFQIRVGRMKTPFLYQFYKLSPQDFVTPELSMFGTNFLQNRQLGIMAHGLLFDKLVRGRPERPRGRLLPGPVPVGEREGQHLQEPRPGRLVRLRRAERPCHPVQSGDGGAGERPAQQLAHLDHLPGVRADHRPVGDARTLELRPTLVRPQL